MTYLYLYIPGMAHEVQLSESADRIPNMGDRLEIDAVRRQVLPQPVGNDTGLSLL